jgi:hypothetical protein
MGDRHDFGVSGLAGGLSGEDICLLVARCTLVPLDPYEVDDFACIRKGAIFNITRMYRTYCWRISNSRLSWSQLDTVSNQDKVVSKVTHQNATPTFRHSRQNSFYRYYVFTPQSGIQTP